MQQENLQQAEKLYFNSGKLEDAYKQAILKITHGDIFTRLVSDLVYHFAKSPHRDSEKFDESSVKLGAMFHEYLKEYDKRLMPVPGNIMNYNQKDEVFHVLNLYAALRERHYLIKALKKLPSIALRNLKLKPEKEDVRFLEYWFKDAAEKANRLNDALKLLPNPDNFSDPETKNKKLEMRNMLLKKIFNSKNDLSRTADTAMQFAHAFTGITDEIEPSEVLDKLEYLDADLIQNSNDVLVIRANDQEAMRMLGCMSLWCFSRPGAQDDWENYAPHGYTYVIYDFKKMPEEATFMMVYLPDSGAVYASTNVPLEEIGIDDSDSYLRSIGVNMSTLYQDVPERKNYEDPEDTIRRITPKKKQQFVNPNQLAIPFEEPEMRQVAELRRVIKKIILESYKMHF